MASYKKIKTIDDDLMRLRVSDRLLALRRQLGEEIPAKTATDTLLLATWNIREFGDNRTVESCYYIAEIIDHFDIVVVQEVNSKKLDGLEQVMSILGDNWSYILSDGVEGTAGGNEAMAFIFNTNKVRFTGMVGRLSFRRTASWAGSNLPGHRIWRRSVPDGSTSSSAPFTSTTAARRTPRGSFSEG